MTKARDALFHRDLEFGMYYEKDRLAHKNIKFYRKIMYPGMVPGRRQKNRIEKWRKRTRIPDYLEISYKLRKVMLVYRPKAHEVFYPFEVKLNEVVDYLSR